ncbi:NAD(P)H-hydrate dehydratase [Flavobacterium psychrotrophum]|uniref:NAD(P)H-hydrate dehydratase n=1 Tax=Flavobacterium psychrotrophum TaxID=2294119 RepID=UPI000E3118C2|nr:NAD(P)H-hydrate dehydratase [Flavobacterium psychrotrophum]
MKIFETINIRQADEITISNQGIGYYELMERAAHEAFLWIKKHFPDKETTFHVFCGRGNNGGDGLVIARLLHEDNYPVKADMVSDAGKPTPEFETALQKLIDSGIKDNKGADYPYEEDKLIYIDALFGIGLNREMPEGVKSVIEKINQCNGHVISIDVPSGLFMDQDTEIAVESDYVLTFQFPKLAFYLPGNSRFVNRVVVLDIGLDKDFISNTPSSYFLVDRKEIKHRYKPVAPHAHKGTQGHALIIGGSYGKIGAVCLSAKAALKSGCGLVTAYIPKCGYEIMQSYFPEAMALTEGEEHISAINFEFNPNAVGLGPGIGQHPETQQAIKNFLEKYNGHLVIDADALNILSQNKDLLTLLPQNTILTPHPKELERLMGSWDNDFEKLDKMKTFAAQYKVILVAKDAHTMVVYGENIYVNSTGNAALATGGTGDCLTGIITGLLAQGYNAVDAALFGVYLHGLTADIAISETSVQAFTASDILHYLGKAYLKIEAECRQK